MSAESLNTCTLSGNIGNDAEVRYTAGGMAITSFSLAVNHRRKQQDGSYADETSWVDCTIFGKRGESLQANGYLQKGAKLAVVGHLRMSTWEADGQRRRKLEVIVDNVIGMTNYSSRNSRRLSSRTRLNRSRHTCLTFATKTFRFKGQICKDEN